MVPPSPKETTNFSQNLSLTLLKLCCVYKILHFNDWIEQAPFIFTRMRFQKISLKKGYLQKGGF